MTKIASRPTPDWVINEVAAQAYADAYQQARDDFEEQWATEQEELIDKLDDFLERRIAAEVDELREELKRG